MTRHPVTEADIHAYTDGQLPPDLEAAVDAWLAEHPADAARVAAYRVQNAELRAAFSPVIEEALPPALDLRLMARPGKLSWYRPALGAMAASLLLMFGGAGGWALRGWTTPPDAGTALLAREAAASFTVYASDTVRPVEIPATDRSELDTWFSRRLDRPIAAPDLSAAGLYLVGGRLVASEHGPAGLYLYRDAAGGRVALYVRPMKVEGTDRMKPRDEAGVSGWTWADKGLGFGMFGAAPQEDLHRAADMVRAHYRQI